MKNDIKKYFKEKYKKASFTVVPGHWSDFQTKEEVDKWFKFMEALLNQFE